MPTEVSITWYHIENQSFFTKSRVENVLVENGVPLDLWERGVYVIRLLPPFAIRYPRADSPVVYIGEGNIPQRISSHNKSWLTALLGEGVDAQVEAMICFPRVRNNQTAYKQLEASLLGYFRNSYNSLPLNNRQNETAYNNHQYDSHSIVQALGLGAGKRYKWSLEPMKANRFYEVFHRTHD